MPRILFLGDSHFNERSRFAECVEIHNRIADIARDEAVDLVVHCGDVYEGPRVADLTERAAFRAWAQRITERASLVLIRGNHDPRGELAEMAKVIPDVYAIEGAEVLHIPYGREGRTIALAGIAWPNRAEIMAHAPSREAGEATLADAVRALFLGLRVELERHNGPRIAAAHAMVRGSQTSAGQPLVGCDAEIGAEDLALLGVPLVVLGHIHKGQEWKVGDTLVHYTGSPRRTAYGEVEDKHVILADFTDDGELVPAPILARGQFFGIPYVSTNARRMVLIDVAVPEEFPAGIDLSQVENADVRIRVTCDADRQIEGEQAAAAMTVLVKEGGAHAVKTELVVRPATRARTPEVTGAVTLAEKLGVLWTARDAVPEGEDREALIARIAEIEEVA